MNAMYHFYPDDELIVIYRQAKNKQDQITIFADLCRTSKAQMRDYLQDLGCDMSGMKLRGRKPKPFDKARAEKLWEEGYTDPEIAEIMGETHARVYQWRHDNGYGGNGVGKRGGKTVL